MDEKTAKVLVTGYNEEWYQTYFFCVECGCYFMTYLKNTMPHIYCPNCGTKFTKEEKL